MKKVVLQNSFLEEVASLLREGQSVRIRIDGMSMHPFINGGSDEVELVPYDKETRPLACWQCVFYRWKGQYMVHRYIGRKDGKYAMMGDGNLAQIETVEENEIYGILKAIYRPDGSVQDCTDKRWLRRGKYWYKLRIFRRFLLPLYRRFWVKGK